MNAGDILLVLAVAAVTFIIGLHPLYERHKELKARKHEENPAH